MITRLPQPGDVVEIRNDSLFNGLLGTVHEAYDWGCIVEHAAKGNGKEQTKVWVLRVNWHEMLYIGTLPRVIQSWNIEEGKPAKIEDIGVIMNHTINPVNPNAVIAPVVVEHAAPEQAKKLHPGERGYKPAAYYDGNPCPQCGALMMKRTGPCLTCDACGFNTGC
jgi:predicted RNA-binding Zn-ribbon protein involved in translation (DUF1610 family)